MITKTLKGGTPARSDWRTERERIDLGALATRLLGPASGRRGASGRKLWWSCPLGTHEDRNPSFCIEPGKTWWKCWGCGESGDAANLVMRLESKSFPEAVASLTGASHSPSPRASRYDESLGMVKKGLVSDRAPRAIPTSLANGTNPDPTGIPEAEALALVESAAARLWAPEGAEASGYLTGPRRCLSPETIRAARIGWTPRANGVAWNPPGLVIPWFVGDDLAMVKVRPPDDWRERFPRERRPPKYLEAFRNPARLVCYPSPASIRVGRPLVVVEGEFDALVLGEALGDMAAVVTLGSASAEPSPAILGQLLPATPWYIATDNDGAGDKAAEKWTGYARSRRVRLPPRFKDWTEAKAAGINLPRWWSDMFTGRNWKRDAWDEMAPELITDEEAAGLRWGLTIACGTKGF